MEPASVSEEGYSLLKGNIVNLINSGYRIMKEKDAEEKFNNWIQDQQKAWIKKAGKKEAEIAFSMINLFIKLLSGFVYNYTHENSFNSIGLIPDTTQSFGRLDMKDYFIQLSFMTLNEIKTKESLLQTETELNKNKILRAIHQNRQLDKDYITHFDFNSVNNLLVVGSPGVGKTTFMKWICNWWADNTEMMNGIPVYIDLKRLNFSTENNPVLQYIVLHYFPVEDARAGEIHNLIKKLSQQFLFLLDGYDELPEENKIALYHAVLQLSSNTRYILTSRPYGILENRGLNWNQSIQLNGFDAANIYNYIDQFITLSKQKGKSVKELTGIIHHNPTLADFSYNPLLLSFMVFIYLSDKASAEDLKMIESRFALQQKVIRWVFQYHREKKDVKFGEEFQQKTALLAFDMEINKQVEKIVRQEDSQVEETMKPLSSIGLSQLVTSDTGNAKFYFNSVTFQEYFASLFLSSRITPAAFEYINQDSFFWNLAGMIIGQLNKSSALHLSLDKLIQFYEKEVNTINRNYAFYKYLLIISECDRNYIRKKIDESRIGLIFRNFVLYVTDKRLRYGIAECLQRIYLKMDEEQQQIFKDLILAELTTFWNSAGNDIFEQWNQVSEILEESINYFSLDKDPDFMECLLQFLLKIIPDFKSNKLPEGAYYTLPIYITELLTEMPDAFFRLYEKEILSVYELTPHFYSFEKASLLRKYKSASTVLADLQAAIHAFNRKSPAKLEQAGEIAHCIFYTGGFVKEYERAGQLDILEDLFDRSIKIMVDSKWFEDESNEEPDDDTSLSTNNLLRLTIEGMLQFDHIPIYTKALELIYSTPDLEWEMENSHLTRTYLSQYTNPEGKIPLDTRIKKLCRLFSQVASIRNQLAVYRDRLLEMVDTYVGKHYKLLTSAELLSYTSSGLQGNMETVRSKADRMDAVLETLHAFHDMLRSDEIYETDKRYLINRMLDKKFDSMDYYREIVFPELMRTNYTFSDQSWVYVFAALEGSVAVKETVLQTLLNESIYEYGGNFKYLKQLTERFFTWRDKEWFPDFLERCKMDILSVIAETLIMMKKTSSPTKNEDKLLIQVTGNLLSIPELQNEVRKADNAISGYTLSAYIFQYYFSGKKSDDLAIDYYKLLSEKEEHLSELFEILYDTFEVKGVLDENAALIIGSVTGKDFLEKLREYASHQAVFNFPFDKNKLLKLLKK